VNAGEVLAEPAKAKKNQATPPVPGGNEPVVARVSGEVSVSVGDSRLAIVYEDKEVREYLVPTSSHIRVQTGDKVLAGQQLTDGSINPQDILHVLGKEAVQQYLVDEVQKVYRSQGVNINDKHIEVIVRQMLTKVIIDASGDTELLPGEIIARWHYEDVNAKILAEGGEPATAHTVLLGITRASLNTDSWLAAASFQETTRVLAEAAVQGKVDRLIRLKENVIIGRLIPARHGIGGTPEALPEVSEAPAALEKAGEPAIATLTMEPGESDDGNPAMELDKDEEDAASPGEEAPEDED
ncbi:MAG: DNA-directed RNA polymerase subunit beta', partial [Chloroflexota bacterium]